jgi:hypothetical protein
MDFDDRDWSLRGNAGYTTPHKFVEHYVAHNEEPSLGCGGKKML